MLSWSFNILLHTTHSTKPSPARWAARPSGSPCRGTPGPPRPSGGTPSAPRTPPQADLLSRVNKRGQPGVGPTEGELQQLHAESVQRSANQTVGATLSRALGQHRWAGRRFTLFALVSSVGWPPLSGRNYHDENQTILLKNMFLILFKRTSSFVVAAVGYNTR